MPQVSLISPITNQAIGKKKVGIYCRVSSNSADQENSYSKQIHYYTEYAKKKPDWDLVDIFADDAISGLKAENRPDFQRMIKMCRLRQIDLIVTKSVSRFARNVKEALEYVRELKLLGIGVQFEKEGINTLALGDEMLLNTFTALAQEESKAISQNVRNSIVKRMTRGEYVDSNAPYGFRLTEKKLTIYEPEAEVIRRVFAMYLAGHSTSEIAKILTNEQVPRKGGSVGPWRSTKIAYMLGNERYAGDCFYQKTFRDNTVPFKQSVNRGQEDRYYAKDTHEAIIDRNTFDQVQNLLSKRHEQFCRTTEQNIYPLTSRIHCAECGSIYRRKVTNGCIKWVCAKHKEDKASCNSNYYSEERITDGFTATVNKLRFGSEDILGVVIAKLESACLIHKRNNQEATQMSQSIADLNSKIVMLEQLRNKGYLAPEVYQSQLREINNKLSELKSNRQNAFESKILETLEEVRKLKSLIFEIEEPLETFDDKLFLSIVKSITVNNRDEMTLTVLGDLRFTELI